MKSKNPKLAGSFAINCSVCNKNQVETASNLWFMYGLLIFARYGVITLVGCRSCIRKAIIGRLILNALGGWWCFPWGLGTPFVIIQNTFELFRPPNIVLLKKKLIENNISPEDVIYDIDGLIREERIMVKAACIILSDVISKIEDKYEYNQKRVVQHLKALTNNRINEKRITQMILNSPLTMNFKLLTPEYRLVLLKIVLDVLGLEGRLSTEKVAIFYEMTNKLGFSEVLADTLLGRTNDENDSKSSQFDHNQEDLNRACLVLSVTPIANSLELKKAFREMMLRYHPDKAGKSPQKIAEYTSKAQEINWAYQFLLERLKSK